MSGLVLDDNWDEGVAEFEAVNVTGLRLVSEKSEVVTRFLREWRSLDKNRSGGVRKISASGALAYDGIIKGHSTHGAILRLSHSNLSSWSVFSCQCHG